jgi:hypothetical protein
MAAGTVTIAGMAKKKPAGDKPNRTPNYTVFARISPELGEAFDAYVNSLRPKPTATSVLQVCIEEFLKEKGFWPPEGK